MQEKDVKENLFKALRDFLDCDGVWVKESHLYPDIPYHYRVTKNRTLDIFDITFVQGHTITLDLRYFPDELVNGLVSACSKKAEEYRKWEREILQQQLCENKGVTRLILPFGSKNTCDETQCILRTRCDMYKQVLQYQKETTKQK